eukprot:3175806-Prymnesium_polylepis.1
MTDSHRCRARRPWRHAKYRSAQGDSERVTSCQRYQRQAKAWVRRCQRGWPRRSAHWQPQALLCIEP